MTKSTLRKLTISMAIGALAFLVAASALADNDPVKRRWHVKCDDGDSLAQALNRVRPGTYIRVSGTCHETVRVSVDRIALDGDPGSAIDGAGSDSEAVLLVEGARNVLVRGLSVQNGRDQGVLVRQSDNVRLEQLRATANGTVGVSIDRSTVDLADVHMLDNLGGGMDAFTASTIVATGTIEASRNGGDGIAANGKTFLELRGAMITATRNGGSGVAMINDSRLQIFSFPEAQGSGIVADGNGFAGIAILGSEIGVVGSQFFGSGANELRATNNRIGFFMPAGSIISPHATGRFVAAGNGVGMVAEDGASALIIGGLDLAGNGAGLSAAGAGTLTLVSVPPNPSRIDANQHDVALEFGTRATLDGVGVTTLSCDDTVLLRGSVRCP